MKTTYVNPYSCKRSDIIDDYEYGLINKREFDRSMNLVDFMEQNKIYPYSNLELDRMSNRLVQPARIMCHIIQKGALATA